MQFPYLELAYIGNIRVKNNFPIKTNWNIVIMSEDNFFLFHPCDQNVLLFARVLMLKITVRQVRHINFLSALAAIRILWNLIWTKVFECRSCKKHCSLNFGNFGQVGSLPKSKESWLKTLYRLANLTES